MVTIFWLWVWATWVGLPIGNKVYSRNLNMFSENNFDSLTERPCSSYPLSVQGDALNTHSAFNKGLFCFALFVCYICVFHFILSPQIEALIKCCEGRRLCFALFFIILWVREHNLLSIKQPESFQQLVMQLEFLELSPHLFVQNGQITAGRISLLGCLRHWFKWPLKSFPAETDVEVAEVSRRVATQSGGLWAEVQVLANVGMIPDLGFIYTMLRLFSTGTCAIRIQCFGNIRDPWGKGDLLSFRTWITTPVD